MKAHSISEVRSEGRGVTLRFRGKLPFIYGEKAKQGELGSEGKKTEQTEVALWIKATTNRINMETNHKYELMDD